MSYEKTTWQNGDTITAEKLNNIENGIAGSIMNAGYVMDGSVPTLSKTWKEIHDHIASSGIVIITVPVDTGFETSIIASIYIEESGNNLIYGITDSAECNYTTNNENGYPAYTHSNLDPELES